MKNLSILIPTYNDECYRLVKYLKQQADALEEMNYEIIVLDDGSTEISVIMDNCRISRLQNCRLIRMSKNCGRSYARNYLASKAQYEWLLFIDSDMAICRHDFLQRYATAEGDVVMGGVVIGDTIEGNLRALYEKTNEEEHTVEKRQQAPYQDFHTANFMIRRDIMLAHPFDQRIRYYGYEDVLLGKRLKEHGIQIQHIDNPVSFEIFESNEGFIKKTEEGLRTLYQFREELSGYSRLLQFVDEHRTLCHFIGWWHCMAQKWERRQLTGNTPNLRIFSLYRLGYYIRHAH